jgi:hypothetical protein
MKIKKVKLREVARAPLQARCRDQPPQTGHIFRIILALSITIMLLWFAHAWVMPDMRSFEREIVLEQREVVKPGFEFRMPKSQFPAEGEGISHSQNILVNEKPIPSETHGLVENVPSNLKLQLNTRKYSYVSLLHGIDSTLAYRGYLYNILIAKKSLDALGSIADFTVLVGFTYGSNPRDPVIDEDLALLQEHGIKLHYLSRLNTWEDRDVHKKLAFSEMALLKITPMSFLEYKKVQFLDGDVFPFINMDCLFSLDGTVCNTGNASPLNSGWYVTTPNEKHFVEMRALAVKRLQTKWDEVMGWGTPIPGDVFFRGGKKRVEQWNFNGASLDQGLLFHYFALNRGGVQLLDVKTAKIYSANHSFSTTSDLSHIKRICNGNLPMEMFYHFTGRSKPWLQDLSDKSRLKAGLKLWAEYLDALHLPLNSSNINVKLMVPPLGYFFPNK